MTAFHPPASQGPNNRTVNKHRPRPAALRRAFKRLTRLGWPRGFAIVQFPNAPLIASFIAGQVAGQTHGAAMHMHPRSATWHSPSGPTKSSYTESISSGTCSGWDTRSRPPCTWRSPSKASRSRSAPSACCAHPCVAPHSPATRGLRGAAVRQGYVATAVATDMREIRAKGVLGRIQRNARAVAGAVSLKRIRRKSDWRGFRRA